jgi:hypothetical protein
MHFGVPGGFGEVLRLTFAGRGQDEKDLAEEIFMCTCVIATGIFGFGTRIGLEEAEVVEDEVFEMRQREMFYFRRNDATGGADTAQVPHQKLNSAR